VFLTHSPLNIELEGNSYPELLNLFYKVYYDLVLKTDMEQTNNNIEE
jgi:hypothetical protein